MIGCVNELTLTALIKIEFKSIEWQKKTSEQNAAQLEVFALSRPVLLEKSTTKSQDFLNKLQQNGQSTLPEPVIVDKHVE